MKTLKEALINKNNRDWAKSSWPNPYKLTKEDQQGLVKNFPLEILTLAIYECSLQNHGINVKRILQKNGVDGAFVWDNTKDGFDFWLSISSKIYQVFYDRYTPEKLKQRLEE